MPLRERRAVVSERIVTWVAWHLPKRLAYWAYIRVAASATVSKFRDRTPDQVSVLDALDAWDRPNAA